METKIKEAMTKHFNDAGKVVVTGYESSSGSIADYTLEYLPSYKALVRESLDVLNSRDPKDADQEVVDAVRASLEKSLANTNPPRASVYSPMEKTDPPGFHRSAKEPDVYYVGAMRVLTKKVTNGVNTPARLPKDPFKAKVAAMKHNLPIGTYLPMLKLSKGKFESITWSK